MPSERPPTADIPALPQNCPELTPTAEVHDKSRLEMYVGDLPGFNHNRIDWLYNVARHDNDESVSESNPPVLMLDDLLRTPTDDPTLHPRVCQVLPIPDIDPFLEGLADIVVPGRFPKTSYQYPERTFQSHKSEATHEALYPSVYPVQIGDIMRELRSWDMLTCICPPGQPLPGPDEIQETIDGMFDDDVQVSATAVLHQSKPGGELKLQLEKCTRHPDAIVRDHFDYLCSSVCNSYEHPIDVIETTDRWH